MRLFQDIPLPLGMYLTADLQPAKVGEACHYRVAELEVRPGEAARYLSPVMPLGYTAAGSWVHLHVPVRVIYPKLQEDGEAGWDPKEKA